MAFNPFNPFKILDAFIRWLLSADGHEDILLFFINAVFGDSGDLRFKSATVQNPFCLKDEMLKKEFILDVRAIEEDGRVVDIEIQTSPEPEYLERAVQYVSRIKGNMVNSGESYDEARLVAGIHFCAFTLPFASRINPETAPSGTHPVPVPGSPAGRTRRRSGKNAGHLVFELRERDAPDLLIGECLRLHFIELPVVKAAMKREKPLSDLEKITLWFTFDGGEDHFYDELPNELREDRVFGKMQGRFRQFMTEEQLRALADSRLNFQRSVANQLHYGMKEAQAKGLAMGLAQGMAQGMAEGIAQGKAEGIELGKAEGIELGKVEGIELGKAEGIAAAQAEIARKLLLSGLPKNRIAELTGIMLQDSD